MRTITRVGKFALNNAFRRKGIALIAILGIGIGITLQITLDSFSNGISESFDDFFGDMSGTLDITEQDKQTFQGQIPRTISSDILSNSSLEEHITAISPEQHLPSSVNAYGDMFGTSSMMGDTISLSVIGIDNLDAFISIDNTLDSLVLGSQLFDEADEVIISYSIYEQDPELFTIENEFELYINNTYSYLVTIVGITEQSSNIGMGGMAMESYEVYTSIETTEKVLSEILLEENSYYHFERLGLTAEMESNLYSEVTIATDVVDKEAINTLINDVDSYLTTLYGKEITVTSMSVLMDTAEDMQAMLSSFLTIISIITLVAGSMGIIVAQLVGIESRMKEFAILKATGWKNF